MSAFAMFDPDAFLVSTGLLDDADVVIKSARFGLFTYPGSSTTTTALIVNYEDAEGKAHEQPYSVGDPEKFQATEDGQRVELNGVTGINASSNFAQFITSLINSGVPKATFQTDNIGVIEGMKLHVNAVAQKDRAGKEIVNAKGFKRTVLLATNLIALPGAKAAAPAKPAAGAPKKAAGAPAKAAAAPAAPATEASQELIDKTVGYVARAATKANGSIKRSALTPAVFQLASAAKDADRTALPKLAFDPDFLTSNSGREVLEGEEVYGFNYDAETQVITPIAA